MLSPVGKGAKIALVSFIVILVGGMGTWILVKHNAKKKEQADFFTMPDFSFSNLDGSAFSKTDLTPGRPVCLMLFNPACELCMEELEAISGAKAKLEGIDFILVTESPKEIVQEFLQVTHLDDWPNMRLVTDPNQEFERVFSLSNIPSAVVYDDKHEFMGNYDGVKVDPDGLLFTLSGDIQVKVDGEVINTINLGEGNNVDLTDTTLKFLEEEDGQKD